jgi:heme exporter protein B
MTIYIAKTLANILMLLLIEFVLLLAATILFSEPLFTPQLLIIVTIGTIGYTALSTLLSAINLDRNNGGLLLPVLALPLLVPLLIASVEATSASLQQETSTAPWILLLSLFTIWSAAIATLMFPLAD